MTTATAPIKRPPRRKKGTGEGYSRTTITLDNPTMRAAIRNARRKNLTLSGYIEKVVLGELEPVTTATAQPEQRD